MRVFMADYHVGSHTRTLRFLLSGIVRSGKTLAAVSSNQGVVIVNWKLSQYPMMNMWNTEGVGTPI